MIYCINLKKKYLNNYILNSGFFLNDVNHFNYTTQNKKSNVT